MALEIFLFNHSFWLSLGYQSFQNYKFKFNGIQNEMLNDSRLLECNICEVHRYHYSNTSYRKIHWNWLIKCNIVNRNIVPFLSRKSYHHSINFTIWM